MSKKVRPLANSMDLAIKAAARKLRKNLAGFNPNGGLAALSRYVFKPANQTVHCEQGRRRLASPAHPKTEEQYVIQAR